jgi:hypothetical protein
VALSNANRHGNDDVAARQDVGSGKNKPALNSRSSAPLQSVYDGRECIGFLLSRGRQGVEAFDAAEQSLGIFRNNREAAAAVSDKAGSP